MIPMALIIIVAVYLYFLLRDFEGFTNDIEEMFPDDENDDNDPDAV